MSFIRKLAAPAISTAVGVGILFSHASPELAVIGATSAGQFVEGVLPAKRTREQVVADEANRVNRAQAYEDFGAAVALCWKAGGQLLTFRPKIVGYVHGMALLVRAQRRFEEQNAATTRALGSILMYGSSETQDAAVLVLTTVAEKFKEAVNSGKQGSPEVHAAYAAASLELGGKVVAWRKCAQADLGMPPQG